MHMHRMIFYISNALIKLTIRAQVLLFRKVCWVRVWLGLEKEK